MIEVKVTLKRSLIGVRKKQKDAIRCLGLRKINGTRVFKDTPALRGQIRVVQHLVSVEEGKFKTKKDKVLKGGASKRAKRDK